MLFSRLIIQIDNEKSNGSRIKDIILYDVKIKSILFRVKRANIDICLRNVISKHDTSDVASKTGDLFLILAKLSFVPKFYKFLNSYLFFSSIDNHKLIYRENK